jgi:hypothetical protein
MRYRHRFEWCIFSVSELRRLYKQHIHSEKNNCSRISSLGINQQSYNFRCASEHEQKLIDSIIFLETLYIIDVTSGC